MQISNNKDKGPVFVRVKAFASGNVNLTYRGEGWTDGGDGYWYYGSAQNPTMLDGGDETTEILIGYKQTVPEGEAGTSYNVIVVYEATPVQYDEEGNPFADWSLSVDTEGGDQA